MNKEHAEVDVSIIVPVYNHERYVEQTLKSIINQETTYTYEILIGEDCSPDHSKDVIKGFEKENPEKIRAFYREQNMGGTRNIYELFMVARGRYVAVLEGDDYWIDKYKIQKQVSFLDKHPEYIGVASNFSIIDKYGNIVEERCISSNHLNCGFLWKDFLSRGFEFHTATLMYHNIYLEEKDYSIFYKAHELVGDLTALTLLLNRSNIYVMEDVMSAYRRIIDKSETNACSIADRDPALSSMKTVRQYVMLQPYLYNKNDFDYLIASHKMTFLKRMIRHRDGYTWKRWKKLCYLGGHRTNLLIIAVFSKKCLQKCTNNMRKVGK
ncbi:MAG: glycosyltransferase [Lachnospiraceae bacterium]|nr:glycosyltransferase [Lachnospiraceae bacterium]